MILKELTLENVGPIKNLTFSFKKNMSVIIGQNGIGKSTILNAIVSAWATQVNHQYFPKTTSSAPFSKIQLKLEKETHTLNYLFDINSLTPIDIQYYPQRNVNELLIINNPYRRILRLNINGPSKDIEERDTNKENFINNNIQRAVDGTDTNFHNWILNRYFFSKEKWGGRYKRELDLFNEKIKLMMKDTDIYFKEVNQNMDIIFHTITGDTSFNTLSSGIQSVIYIIYNTIYSLTKYHQNSNDIFSERALVLIDEIETHLHPAWQQQILMFLTEFFPNCQFIVTTHSPLVITSCTEDEFFPLSLHPINEISNENNKNVRLEKKDPKGWLAEDIFSEFMGINTSRDPETQKSISKILLLYEKKIRKILTKEELSELDYLIKKFINKLPPNDPVILLNQMEALLKKISGDTH